MKTLFLVILAVLFLPCCTHATDGELQVGRFGSGDMSGWKEQTIGLMKPRTAYAITMVDNRLALGAISKRSASGMIYKKTVDPKKYPILAWSWKIRQTIKKGDERVKEGDDYAARVYVLFPRGFFSKTRALCYVWANKIHRGAHLPSPFTSNVITVAVDSGDERAGTWVSHQRNVYDDYRAFFGEEPPAIGAIALMTDSDNTGESATAFYGDISLVSLNGGGNGRFMHYSSQIHP